MAIAGDEQENKGPKSAFFAGAFVKSLSITLTCVCAQSERKGERGDSRALSHERGAWTGIKDLPIRGVVQRGEGGEKECVVVGDQAGKTAIRERVAVLFVLA